VELVVVAEPYLIQS